MDPEPQEASPKLIGRQLSWRILKCAFAVHSELGPGLLESAYRACLVRELELAQLQLTQEVPVPLRYRDSQIDCAYRADIIVEDQVLLELKAVEKLMPIHDAQLLTYLKLRNLRVGILLNFNSIHLRDGLRRMIR